MELYLLILISSACVLLTEVLKRKLSLSTSLTRRVVHVTTASVAAIAPFFVSETEIIIVSLVFAVALLWSRSHKVLTSIHSVERKTYGEVWLPLGVAIAAFLFLPDSVSAFQFGVLVMGISDPLAGLTGDLIGKHRIRFLNSIKTVEGSAAFFISTLLLTSLFVPVFGYHLLLIPLLLMVVEFVLIYGLDNLVLPVVAASCIKFISELPPF